MTKYVQCTGYKMLVSDPETREKALKCEECLCPHMFPHYENMFNYDQCSTENDICIFQRVQCKCAEVCETE